MMGSMKELQGSEDIKNHQFQVNMKCVIDFQQKNIWVTQIFCAILIWFSQTHFKKANSVFIYNNITYIRNKRLLTYMQAQLRLIKRRVWNTKAICFYKRRNRRRRSWHYKNDCEFDDSETNTKWNSNQLFLCIFYTSIIIKSFVTTLRIGDYKMLSGSICS